MRKVNFFFQAEDGIRDYDVTGVQTCALPILVRGEKTSEAVQNAAAEFFERIGKVPVRVKKEVIGHVANRMAAALWREAVHIVAEGIASVEDVDRSIRFGPGLRWAIYGPHMLYHMGGGDSGIRG